MNRGPRTPTMALAAQSLRFSIDLGLRGAVFGPRDHEKLIRGEKLPPGKGSGPLGPRIEKIISADVWVVVVVVVVVVVEAVGLLRSPPAF